MTQKKPSQTTQETVYARLSALDEETQRRIAKKYYGGNRPWKPEKGRKKSV